LGNPPGKWRAIKLVFVAGMDWNICVVLRESTYIRRRCGGSLMRRH
jgi:hypothetical protein